MNILIVGQYFWPENFRINEVAQALCRLGCHVEVLTGAPNYPDGVVYPGYSATSIRSERMGSVSIHRVPVIPRGRGSAVRLVLNYVSFVVSACIFGPWSLFRRQFDVVLVYAISPILQAIPAIWLAREKGAAVVIWVQDLWPESLEATGFVRNRHALRLVGALVRWIYRRADLLLVQSRAFIEPVRALAGGTPIIYHPNPGELPAVATNANSGVDLQLTSGFNVVFAGNLGKVQALETILDAAEGTREHRDIWWFLIGSGSRGDWLSSEIRRRGLSQVVLAGRFPAEAMPAILSQASVLLVTLARSTIMSYTVPSKVQAYLAAGRPIIAALDGEGARVVVEAGAGVACSAEDPKALAEAVLHVKGMAATERERLGESGREYYRRHFHPDLLNERLIECLRAGLQRQSTRKRMGSSGSTV